MKFEPTWWNICASIVLLGGGAVIVVHITYKTVNWIERLQGWKQRLVIFLCCVVLLVVSTTIVYLIVNNVI